jgi:transposase-like protein
MPINYPTDIRTAIYTTNSVESLNRSLRKIIKIRGGFPNEEAALKLLFLALRQSGWCRSSCWSSC